MHFQQTNTGFELGEAKVTMLACDDEKGWVAIGVETKQNKLKIYVNKKGRIQVFDKDENELKKRR